jgi:ribosome recycling factor
MASYKFLNAKEITERYTKHLSGIRSGRVNASILETILVEAYGSMMHFHELATITIPEPAQLLITPFDKGLIGPMVKAISNSNIGVNPMDDGAGIRLNFPPLTEETRKQRVKEIHKLMEEAKIEIRLKRQDAIKTQKAQKESGDISEDDLKQVELDIQKEVEEVNKEVERITKSKEEEIMKM